MDDEDLDRENEEFPRDSLRSLREDENRRDDSPERRPLPRSKLLLTSFFLKIFPSSLKISLKKLLLKTARVKK